jgi:hypothetical protein
MDYSIKKSTILKPENQITTIKEIFPKKLEY